MQYVINLFYDLLPKPTKLTTSSKYTELNGLIYLVVGVLLVIWPRLVQTLFMERAFVADEQWLIGVIELTVVVIGWLYLFGGRSGGEQVVAASVVDRLIFVPLVRRLEVAPEVQLPDRQRPHRDSGRPHALR
jgi:hypothetical protein